MAGKKPTKPRIAIDARIDARLWKEAKSLAATRGIETGELLDDAVRLFLQEERKRIEREKDLDSVPYGYSSIDGKLVQNRGEQGTIRRIIGLKERGRTPSQIAIRLNDSRVRTKTGKKWDAQAVKNAQVSFKGHLRERISDLNRVPVKK
jgi:hypothetical protein